MDLLELRIEAKCGALLLTFLAAACGGTTLAVGGSPDASSGVAEGSGSTVTSGTSAGGAAGSSSGSSASGGSAGSASGVSGAGATSGAGSSSGSGGTSGASSSGAATGSSTGASATGSASGVGGSGGAAGSASGGTTGASTGASAGRSSGAASGTASSGTVGASGSSSGASSGALTASCPASVPPSGSACAVANQVCEYGSSPSYACNTIVRCQSGQWTLQPAGGCTTGGTCPLLYPGKSMPACSLKEDGFNCAYPGLGPPGTGTCVCSVPPGPPTSGTYLYYCFAATAACPTPRPRVGTRCTTEAQVCDYGACLVDGIEIACRGGTWVQNFPPCAL